MEEDKAMPVIIKLTVCEACDKKLGLGWGDLNTEFDRPERCSICKVQFIADDDYENISAYNHEIELDDIIALLFKRLFDVESDVERRIR